jgi:acyl carrier protein
VLDNASITEQSWDRMSMVFRPKIDGAWNLHILTRQIPLEFFVLFSSWASIAGSHGQANHCAANAFLDGLSHFRRAKGLPALSVNWGAWGETGAASGDKFRRQLARSGMEQMQPPIALQMLSQALISNEAQAAIAAINWKRYLGQHLSPADSSIYANMLSGVEVRRARKHSTTQTELFRTPSAESATLEAVLALPASGRESALLRTAGDLVRKTLDLRLEEEIDPDAPFSDLGMDSLLAIELRNSLSGVLRKQFPSTILFDYPTLRTLVRYLDNQIVNQTPPPAAMTQPVAVAGEGTGNSLDILDTIEQMSDDEVESWFK